MKLRVLGAYAEPPALTFPPTRPHLRPTRCALALGRLALAFTIIITLALAL